MGSTISAEQKAVFFQEVISSSEEIFVKIGGPTQRAEFCQKWIDAFSDPKLNAKGYDNLVMLLNKDLRGRKGTKALMKAIRKTAYEAPVQSSFVSSEEAMEIRAKKWVLLLTSYKDKSDTLDEDVGSYTIPLLFATNRLPVPQTANQNGGKSKSKSAASEANKTSVAFTGNRYRETTYGYALVSVPDKLRYHANSDKRLKRQNRDTWRYSKTRSGTDNSKVATVACVAVKEDNIQQLREVKNPKEATVFIHGYWSTFNYVITSAAPFAYAANFSGPILFFSWPSNGRSAKYTSDEAAVMWAIQDFLKFLNFLVNDLKMEKVHLVSHSMGNRLSIYALLRLRQDYPELIARKRIGQVVLSAADFDFEEFVKVAGDVKAVCDRMTIYCCSNDEALKESEDLHGAPRLGDFRAFQNLATVPEVFRNITVIDTTSMPDNFSWGWLHHSYMVQDLIIAQHCGQVLRGESVTDGAVTLQRRALRNNFVYYNFPKYDEKYTGNPSKPSVHQKITKLVAGAVITLAGDITHGGNLKVAEQETDAVV